MKRILQLTCVALLLPLGVAWAQDRTVTGKVTSTEDGSALPGVNVVLKGTAIGTATDTDGRYSLSVPASGGSLVFSFIGLQTQEIAIGDRSTIDVSLALDATQLSEVVIVGYGTTTKESFVGTAKSVSAANIQGKSFTNISNAMAGEVAGLTVINTSGQPGTVATVRIRGFGSVNGSRDPLYVVDGVPLTNTSSLNSINNADITSYTVLKDATATAIYGARGANGVIVITTRGGSSGKSSIEAEYNVGVNFNGLPRYDVIKSPEEYIGLTWEGMRNRGIYENGLDSDAAAIFANNRLMAGGALGNTNLTGIATYNMWNVTDGSQLIDPATGKVRAGVTRKYDPENWNDYGFQSSQRQEANVRLSGGGDKSQHYLSLGYLNDVGYIINSDYNRVNLRTNLRHQVTKWLSASANVAFNSSDQNRNGQSSDSGSIFWFVDNIPSVYPLFMRDEDGNKIADPYYGGFEYDYGTGRNFGAGTNSISDAHINKVNTKRNEVVGNLAFNIDFTDYLTFEARYGVQYALNNNTSMNSPFYGSGATAGGTLSRNVSEAMTQNFLKMLKFNKNFGNHTVEALVAHESNDYTFKVNGATKRKAVHHDLDDFSNYIIAPSQPWGYRDGAALESYFGQVNYNFGERYFLTGSVRRDGSSRFIDPYKWGTFGSVGGAWIVSKESFFASLPENIINFLKVKGSYGITGEQSGVGYWPGYNTFDMDNVNDGYSIVPRDNGQPELTWEKAKMWQAGVEFELLGGRIEGLVDYYHKTTDNLIFDRRVGPSAGIAIIKVNDGILENKGVEFDVTGHILDKAGFKLDLSVNGAFNTNVIKTMPIDPATGLPKVYDNSTGYGWAKGHSIFDYYIYEWAGVDPADGRGMWYRYFNDINDNGVLDAGEAITDMVLYKSTLSDAETDNLNVKKTVTKTYSEATLNFVGKSAIPKLRGGFRLSAAYKGFDLGVQFVYSFGGYAYDGAYASLMNNGTALNNNWHKDIHGRWQQPGDITDVPRLTEGLDVNVASRSTRWLVKSDYLALNNVRLGYTVPQNLLRNLYVKGLNVWVSGDNLFLASARAGFNPATNETGATSTYRYSPLTTISGGLRVTF
ncbi:MAG: SusC/RagA family TonB-linked outer membrane protein [Cyclobacteriaceae bacterium]|nr:SusC/RagA family TonB-linked outer membrane protein [Cyclobacteriaceae bacterium]